MRIAVLGAGVVGMAAAYYLAKDGHEVTVIDRHPEAASGTSRSNVVMTRPGTIIGVSRRWCMCGRPPGCKRKNENSDGQVDCDHVSGLLDAAS